MITDYCEEEHIMGPELDFHYHESPNSSSVFRAIDRLGSAIDLLEHKYAKFPYKLLPFMTPLDTQLLVHCYEQLSVLQSSFPSVSCFGQEKDPAEKMSLPILVSDVRFRLSSLAQRFQNTIDLRAV